MATSDKSSVVITTESLIHPDCVKKLSVRPITNVAEIANRDANKTILIDGRGFLFDIIVVRLDISNKNINDTSKFIVEVDFNGKNMNITSSRINVLDFKPEPIMEFVANPLKLKEDLCNNPLRLKVIEESKTLGYGSFKWPEEFLNELVECAGEMIHTFEIELKECDGTKTGIIQVIIRLQPKCEEYMEDYTADGKCRNANKEIDPNDVLFVVAEDQKPCCCCSEIGIIPASDSDHDLLPKCLDLSNFQAVNSQNVDNINILNSLDPACQKLKAVTNHYQQIIDAIKTKGKNSACAKSGHLSKGDTFCTMPSDNSFKMNVLPSSSDSYHLPLQSPSDNKAFEAKNYIQIAHQENPPDLIENEPIAYRFCPLCKENISFLPKLAACPNCCYKPVPSFEEKPYDETQNADEILKDFQDKLQTNDNPSSNANLQEQSKCHCTCKYGSNKPCAHCRIRKLCEEIFHKPFPIVKPEDVCEKKSSEVHYCSSADNRPFLTKVFSELKDLYDIELPKRKEFQPDERCEKKLNKEPRKKKEKILKNIDNNEIQREKRDESKEITKKQKYRKSKKRVLKPATELAAKSRLYDYQLVRQSFSKVSGHKTCINGFAGRKNVPSNMGWLWNINNHGKWKPGYIRKPIKELMKYFLKDFPADTLLVSQYSYRKKSKNTNDCSPGTLIQKPTLHIHKKNGEYIVTMRPLKPVNFLKDAADPYENMKPIQFRIVKNPQLEVFRNLKQTLKDMGFKKCTCHRPILYCYCRNFIEKKRLEYECNRECFKRDMESCCDSLILSDTSDSEAEFDFGVTPPVGVIKPEKLKKVDRVNVATQYEELDWNPVPLFPQPPNKYMQMYQCAVGEREAKSIANANGVGGTNVGSNSGNVARSGSCPKGSNASNYGKVGVGLNKGGSRINRGVKDVGGKFVKEGILIGTKAKAGVGGAVAVGNAIGVTNNVVGVREGGGDGITVGKVSAKGVKYGKHVDPNNPKRKVDMLRYTMKVEKKLSKMTPAEIAAKRKEKMNLLKGVNPPLLCTVDRRGKPIDPCTPCFPYNPYSSCLPDGDNRIC